MRGWGLVGLSVLVGGCVETNPPAALVHFPVTYQIPIGRSATAPVDRLNGPASPAQDVAVRTGAPVYFRIASPVAITAYVYEKRAPSANGSLLAQVSGTVFGSCFTPDTPALEFVFAAPDAPTGGTLLLTLSDQPISAAVQTAEAAASNDPPGRPAPLVSD